jgi:hypothetical protein
MRMSLNKMTFGTITLYATIFSIMILNIMSLNIKITQQNDI